MKLQEVYAEVVCMPLTVLMDCSVRNEKRMLSIITTIVQEME